MVRPRFVAISKVHADLPPLLHLDPADRVAFIDGDYRCSRLELDYASLQRDFGVGVAGVVVSGALEVDGAIVNQSVDDGPRLMVGGALSAEHLVVGGSVVVAQGDARLTQSVVGRYNHGLIIFGGALVAPLVCTVEITTKFLEPVDVKLLVAKEALTRFEPGVLERSLVGQWFKVGAGAENTDAVWRALAELDSELFSADMRASMARGDIGAFACPDVDLLAQWALAGRSAWKATSSRA